ncbi:lipopolysaccharide biosynthesis protein [Kocuria rhizosphaericola]|uniref:lipopolysaccharide biosynthesis protein n=1 Tax=Kocuria rhizosphaericola TaxID=3376284 RepID=UPI003791459A
MGTKHNGARMHVFSKMPSLVGKAFSTVGLLTLARVSQLSSILVISILLGRSAGPATLGSFSIILAAGFVMQSVSVAGLAGVALHDLLKPGNDYKVELRVIFFARLIITPVVFAVGTLVMFLIPGTQLPSATTVLLFFAGYAVGAFDVPELTHMAGKRYRIIAIRRMTVVLIVAPLAFWGASSGRLELTLLLIATQSILWQVVLIPGSGLSISLVREIPVYWKASLARVWKVRVLWVSSIIGAVASRIDLFAVSTLLGVAATGHYYAVSRPVEATAVVASSLTTVLFHSIIGTSTSPRLYARESVRASKVTFVTSAGLVLGLSILGPFFILLLYGSDFDAAAAALPIYAFIVFFIFQDYLLSNFVVVEKLYRTEFVWSVVTIVVNVSLNLLLIPELGLVGAALAAVLTRPISVAVAFLPHRQGRRALAMAYGGVAMGGHRAQHYANALVRSRRVS